MPNTELLSKNIFLKSTLPKINIDFISIGHRKCVPDFSCWTAQAATHYIIHFNLSGKVTFYYDNKSVILEKNDIFVFFPNTTYRFIADHDHPLDYVWLSFRGEGADVIMKNFFVDAQKPFGHFDRDISSLFFDIINMENNLNNIGRKYEKLYNLLNYMIDTNKNSFETLPIDVSEKNNAYFLSALNYISHNYNTNIKISDLANHLYISRDYLFKLFIKNTGMSPSNFITSYKINEAMQLFSNKKLTLSEIAHKTGFYDVYHFSKTFKKIHKKTPTQYRRELFDIIK